MQPPTKRYLVIEYDRPKDGDFFTMLRESVELPCHDRPWQEILRDWIKAHGNCLVLKTRVIRREA